MKSRFSSLTDATIRAIPGMAMAVLWAGCTDTPRWGGWSTVPTKTQIETGLRRLDTYLYYPGYQIYFNAARGQYTFWSDGDRAWATSDRPPLEVPAELLETAASVALVFDNAPEWHHAEVVRLYPPQWSRPKVGLVSAQ